MRSETSRSVSIPAAGECVKQLLSDALVDCPVRARDMGLDVSVTACVEDVLFIIKRLLEAEGRVSVRVRFYLGDLYNQVTRRKDIGKGFPKYLRSAMGDNHYNLLRKYGWVAGKWREDRRSDSKCWAFYVNNEPGRPGLPKREKPPQELVLVARDGDLLTLKSASGVEFLFRWGRDDQNERQHSDGEDKQPYYDLARTRLHA